MTMSSVRVYSEVKKFRWVPVYVGTESDSVQSLTHGPTHMSKGMVKFFSELKVEC